MNILNGNVLWFIKLIFIIQTKNIRKAYDLWTLNEPDTNKKS